MGLCKLLFSLFILISRPAYSSTILYCGEMLDVRSGEVLKNQVIEVNDGKIIQVESANAKNKTIKPGKDAKVVRLTNQICMPGWIDTHVHFEQELPEGMNTMDQPDEARQALDSLEFPKKDLLAGFTTVRDLGSARNIAIEFRNAIQAGKMVGPRIIATRAPISAPGGHGDFLDEKKPGWAEGKRQTYMNFYGFVFVTKPEDINTWFKINFDERPDWEKKFNRVAKEDKIPDGVKVMATGGVVSPGKDSFKRQLSDSLIARVIVLAKEYSQKYGRPLPVAAHAHGIDGIWDAAQAGVDSIEHGTELGGPIRQDLSESERKEYEKTHAEAVRLIREKHIYVAPTVGAAQSVVDMAKADKLPPVIREKALSVGTQMLKNFSKVVDLDLPLVFGTDTGVSSHGQNWREFVLLVELGKIKPVKAFQMATLEAAKSLKREKDFGVIEPGLSADIIALPKKVMKDIHMVNQVSFVMKEGSVYKAK